MCGDVQRIWQSSKRLSTAELAKNYWIDTCMIYAMLSGIGQNPIYSIHCQWGDLASKLIVSQRQRVFKYIISLENVGC